MEMERRTISSELSRLEIREDGQPPRIEGYGAVYFRAGDPGTEYRLWADTYERIMPGAFDEAVKADVRSLFNHDPNIILGRNRGNAATLRLTSDSTGLRYSVEPPQTALIRDQVLEPIRRGDVSGSSFMFRPTKVTWVEEDRDGRTVDVRELHAVELFEVGPVTFPAYEATSTGVRSAEREAIESERREWRERRQIDIQQEAARQRKIRETEAEVALTMARL
jgi:uncharacterized protein